MSDDKKKWSPMLLFIVLNALTTFASCWIANSLAFYRTDKTEDMPRPDEIETRDLGNDISFTSRLNATMFRSSSTVGLTCVFTMPRSAQKAIPVPNVTVSSNSILRRPFKSTFSVVAKDEGDLVIYSVTVEDLFGTSAS